MEQFSIKHRPKSFEDIFGQEPIRKDLQKRALIRKFPKAMLLKGMYGTGKTTAAHIIAMTIQCNALKNGEPCGVCASCKSILNERFDRDTVMFDGSQVGQKDNMIEFTSTINVMPMYDRARVFIIEEADQLSTGAGNALLKILETPQENVHFILLSMQAGGVSNAIQSRCLTFNFKPVGIADTMRALKRIMEKEELWSSPAIPESFKMEGLAAIAGNAKGSLREALQLLERCLEGEYWTAALIQENLGIVDEVATYRILDALLSFSKAEEVWTSIYNSDPGELYNYITLILADAMICKLTGFTKDERFASSTKQLASNSNLELLYSALTNYAPLAKPYTRRADLLAAIANYYMKGAPVLREETIPQRVVGRRMVAGRST